MKKTRMLHLWIGLITSLILFVEAGSGLLLAERWLMAPFVEKHAVDAHTSESHQSSAPKLGIIDAVEKASQSGAFKMDEVRTIMNHGSYIVVLNDKARTVVTVSPQGEVLKKESNWLSGIVRGLHVGKIGDVNFKWAIDVSAISILFLTGTGIFLSIRILRAQNKQKKKQMLKQQMQNAS